MSDKDKTMGAALTALELKLEETQADRNKMAGSLQKSSVALQERDEVVSALRKEIEELKKKLGEKKD
jgi:seryl-tRNA synthetase